jgi:hypothetical protein
VKSSLVTSLQMQCNETPKVRLATIKAKCEAN